MAWVMSAAQSHRCARRGRRRRPLRASRPATENRRRAEPFRFPAASGAGQGEHLRVVDAGKKLSVVGNNNATTYVEVFPLIKENRLWKGATANSIDTVFGVPKGTPVKEADRLKAERLGYPSTQDRDFTRMGHACWFTNIEHGRRHEPLQLMTMSDNIKFSKHKDVRGLDYQRYYNFKEAIEVPWVDSLPSDYDGPMGVPITFLDKYNPDHAYSQGPHHLRQRACELVRQSPVEVWPGVM
jgi:Adenine-specific methyltransferase EcoRI